MTQCFTLDAGATITGVGTGNCGDQGWLYVPGCGSGPGEGLGYLATDIGFYLSAGGGHGGAGSVECDYLQTSICANGGAANDDPIHPCFMGSGGSMADAPWTGSPPGSSGGGLLKIVVLNGSTNVLASATVNGTIDMSGYMGMGQSFHHAGGGAGGTVLIEADSVLGTGVLRANGGNGGPGAGGGGGIISLIENLSTFGGSISVMGGNSGNPGIVTFTPSPVSGY